MRTRTRIGVGVAGGAIVLAGVLGTAGAASAATADDDTVACTGMGAGQGMGGWAASGMRGGWQGQSAVAEYLAEALEVDVDDVTAALTEYHADNPVTERGRDLSEADLEARHAAEAAYLADALGVSVADVTAALDAFQVDRQAERTAALEELLDTRVSDGTLTQDEADAILESHEAGEPIGLGGGMGMRGGHGGMGGQGGMRGTNA